MINRYLIGFICVAGVTVAGVDYLNQSQKADLPLGALSWSEYADTVPQRINGARAEASAAAAEKERKAAWRRGGVEFLPEAPDGWTRRALMEGDDSAIMPPDKSTSNDGAGQTLLQQMERRENVKKARKRATRSYVYERGSETVFVEVRLQEKPNSNSLTGLVGTMLSNEDFGGSQNTLGYTTIGGVPFVEDLFFGGRKFHYRVLEGRIGFGDEVHIRVHANAGSAGTNEILTAIDYDGLNALLPMPMQQVGNDADLPDGADPAEFALALDGLYDEFMRLRAREAQYRIDNIDTNALVFNTYAEQLDEGAMRDITGTGEMDLGTLIDVAYRTAAAAVWSGKSPDDVQSDVTRMVETAVTLADAETAAMAGMGDDAPAPAMSPELAAELGLDAPAPPPAAPRSSATDTGPEQTAQASRGRAMMQIDADATKAAGGNVMSKPVDAADFARFKADRAATQTELQLGLMVVARAFETKHNMPAESCAFVEARHRLECDAPPKKPAGGILGMVSKVMDSQTNQPQGLQTGEMPKRLELSNGGNSGGSRCVGSFCD
ncbi:MAG: hypothetical protein NXH74_00885 [Rhodobacteraceae bacterium]|nr:hypothetical protein [Paracoccaceae bacterium]